MNHDASQDTNQDASHNFERISAFLDGALSPAERQGFLLLLEQRPDLAAQVEAERRFRAGFRSAMSRETAPAALRARIGAALAQELAGEEADLLSAQISPPTWRQRVAQIPWLHPAWWTTPRRMAPLYTAALALAVVVIMGGSTWAVSYSRRGEDHTIVRQMAGRHRVYFETIPTQPALDVSGSSAQIRTWAAPFLPFYVEEIPALSGWQLMGGRLGEFHHRGTLSLLYAPQDADLADAAALARTQISLTLFFPQPQDFPADSQRDRQSRTYFVGQDEATSVVLWRDDDADPTTGFALVGGPGWSVDDLLTLADTLRAGP